MTRILSKKYIIAFVCIGFGYAFAKAQTATATLNQDPNIAQLIGLKSKMTKENKLSERYKIQLYSGDRVTAESRLRSYRNEAGLWIASLQYETPNYKVWVGNFRNRLEADRALMIIKRDFPAAFIFKPER